MSYVHDAWYVAGWGRDAVVGTPIGLTILEKPIVVWRDGEGQIHALENRCVHRLAPLSLGRCEGSNLRCMYHGFLFDATGRVIEIPSQDDIPSIARVRHYPVVEQDSWIWVWMGDWDRADVKLIPRVIGIDDPGYELRHGQIDYDAEARLINDNLTDFSHLSFVHANSFTVNEAFAKAQTSIAAIDRGIRIQRWAADQPPMGEPDSPVRLDVYLTYDYLVPGILRLITKLYPAGTFASTGPVDPEPGREIMYLYSAQAVTPTGARSSRYFFSNGSRTPAGDGVVDGLWSATLRAFGEDKIMIEAQQRIIDLDPHCRIMPAAGDKATVLYNRMVDRLVREEVHHNGSSV